jgi:putative proteasome-type protease
MTFCLGMKTRDGLVGIADTRMTSGTETITGRKYSIYHRPGESFFLMTSGLRSVRDKTLTYFDDLMDHQPEPLGRLYKAVNLFASCVRKVDAEDRHALLSSGLTFDILCLIGGQFSEDREHRLYMVYPQGNWVEIAEGTPYQIIGIGGYGKPILDRTFKYEDPMRFALKVGYLAFDSTRISSSDVGFPVDVLLYAKDSNRVAHHRYEMPQIRDVSAWWDNRLRRAVEELPSEWLDHAMGKLDRHGQGDAPDTRLTQAAQAQQQ